MQFLVMMLRQSGSLLGRQAIAAEILRERPNGSKSRPIDEPELSPAVLMSHADTVPSNRCHGVAGVQWNL
jgi:hypothetical protein